RSRSSVTPGERSIGGADRSGAVWVMNGTFYGQVRARVAVQKSVSFLLGVRPCGLLSQSQPSCNKRSCPSIPTPANERGRKMMRTTGPAPVQAPWNAKAGKAARRLARFSSSPAPARRALVLGEGKRDRFSRACTKTGSGIALAMHFLFSDDEDWMPQDVPNDDRHPEARAIASRLWPTGALLIRSRVNPRSVGDGPGLAAHPSRGCEPRPRGGSKVP